MGLHAYCITPSNHEPAAVTGLDGARVIAVVGADLAAWASELPAPAAASIDAVRMHDAVIRVAMTERVTPVPLRFGQWAADRDVLLERLGEHAARWRELLRGFAGAVEMGIRLTPAVAAAAPPAGRARAASGREYMAQLAARVHDRDALEREHARLLERIGESLGDVAFRTASGVAPDDGRTLWVAHLVLRSRAGEYRRLADRIAQHESGYRTAVTGPWPPYSFGS